MHAVRIPTEEWPAYADILGAELAAMAAGSGGRYEASDIDTALRLGRMQGWLASDGATIWCLMVTETAQYPRFRALRVVGLAGQRMARWVGLWPAMEAAARADGCSRIEVLAPERYGRLLTGLGMMEFHTLWEKAL